MKGKDAMCVKGGGVGDSSKEADPFTMGINGSISKFHFPAMQCHPCYRIERHQVAGESGFI